MTSLKKRNRAVLMVLLAIIALIFAITIVKIKVVGQMAIATPATPYGHASGEPDGKTSGDMPADNAGKSDGNQ